MAKNSKSCWRAPLEATRFRKKAQSSRYFTSASSKVRNGWQGRFFFIIRFPVCSLGANYLGVCCGAGGGTRTIPPRARSPACFLSVHAASRPVCMYCEIVCVCALAGWWWGRLDGE
jgi:hypothetical protein